MNDVEFLVSLPEALRELGESLISTIRTSFPGHLVYYPKPKMWVNAPDNFFTLTIRPKKKLIAVTIYGRPEFHSGPFTFGICMSRYSWFAVQNLEEVNPAITVIRHAKELKDVAALRRKIKTPTATHTDEGRAQ